MSVDVSVVIPMFNAGANLEDSLRSLLMQTLDRGRLEIIVLDDGSTDGSGDRADSWANRYPDTIRVHHLVASGGPARPRNLGIAEATGRYIQFLDSDDTLGPRALERLLEVADESAADVVLPKLSCDFRGLYHPLFRRTVTHRTLADFPLMQNANVSKFVRRDFLLEHNVRFPEGPQYIEDTTFCLLAYAHATSVAVVGDTACYFYRRRRTGGPSVGETTIVPADYYRELGVMFDILDEHVPALTTRLEVLQRLYRNEMLGRLRGTQILHYDTGYRAALVEEVKRLATDRLPPQVHAGLPMFLRVQSRLVLDGDIEGLTALAAQVNDISLKATGAAHWEGGGLVIEVDARLTHGEEWLAFDHDGDDWLVPASIAPHVPADDRRMGAGDATELDLDLDLVTISRLDASHWSTTEGLRLDIEPDGRPHITGTVVIDPRTVMGGSALTPGLYDLRLQIRLGGLICSGLLLPAGSPPPNEAWIYGEGGGPPSDIGAGPPSDIGVGPHSAMGAGPHSAMTFTTRAAGALALDVDEWSHALVDVVAGPRASCRVTSGQLSVTAPGLRGAAGTAIEAELILSPTDAVDLGVVTLAASVSTAPTGSELVADIGPLPGPGVDWAVWVRIGPTGGTPPVSLPVTVSGAGSGSN